ncbi:MAG: thioredoxin family protein [Gammaproteobacteria bacterium]
MTERNDRPDALLLMGKQCPYCPTVLKALESLQQDGTIDALETVFIEDHPEMAAELGVRSVPWLRLGPYELSGLRSAEELREWAGKAGSLSGMSTYLAELIASGSIDKCLELIRADSYNLKALLHLFTRQDTELNIRIGISAIMESLQGDPVLDTITDDLHELLSHDEPGVRGDACYYLALSGRLYAVEWIRQLLNDSDKNVREIAHDSLEQLAGAD